MSRASALLLVAALAAGGARAAETDPYYGWFHPPRDGTWELDRHIRQAMARGLADVNRDPPKECHEAAAGMAASLGSTAAWYWAGSTRSWHVDASPRNRSEYDHVFRKESTYRWAPLLPWGSLIPFDPTVRVGDILFGTDKLGHFFTNGLRYDQRWRALKQKGASDDAAELGAILSGIEEEEGILGINASGIFSFADLESNWRGFEFLQSLCEGPNPSLVKEGGRWVLTKQFSIEDWIDPCWDEGFNPSWFTKSSASAVQRAIATTCQEWESRPDIARRWRAYEARGCPDNHSRRVLADQVKKGLVPDPAPFSIVKICGAPTGITPGPRWSGACR